MDIIASLGRGLGSWLGLPSRDTLGLSAITASLPLGEVQLPGSRPVTLVTAPSAVAPVATGGPGQLIRGTPPDLAATINAITVLRKASPRVRAQAVAARPLGKAAPAPALLDDNQTPTPPPADDPETPPGIDEIISQLLDLVLQLKKTVQVTSDDDAETQAALGLFGAGQKLSASRALMAVTKKMCDRPKLTSTQKISRGFSAQSGVSAIEACLRPGPRTALAVVSTPAAPAVTAVASPSGSRERVQALRAEIGQIDREQRKQFSNERNARAAALSRELRAEMKKFHVS